MWVVELYKSAERALGSGDHTRAAELAEKVLEAIEPERSERGTVVETLFRAYMGVYANKPEAEVLCRIDEVLRDYERSVHETYSDEPENISQILEAIHEHRTEVRTLVARDGVECPETPVIPDPKPEVETPPPQTVDKLTVTTPTPPGGYDDRPNRRVVAAGGTFIGLGVALLGSTGIIGGVYVVNNNELRNYLDRAEAEDRPLTGEEMLEANRLHQRSQRLNWAMIATGITGGTFAAVGITTLAVGVHRRRRAKRLAIQPLWSPGQAGVLVQGRF